jgi:hypothetical protein
MPKNIRGYGQIEIYSRKSSKGYRRLNGFLKQFMIGSIKTAYSFYDRADYLPFNYGERQLSSILCPALSKLTQTVFMEVPLDRVLLHKNQRRIKNKIRKGWVDYTCQYGSPPIDYFIEVKHSWNCCWKDSVSQDPNKKWQSVVNQLNTVKGQVKNWSSNIGSMRIAVLFLIHYSNNKTINGFSFSQMQNQHDKVIGGMKKKPNWSALLFLHKKYHEPYEPGKFIPAISWYAFAYSIQKN